MPNFFIVEKSVLGGTPNNSPAPQSLLRKGCPYDATVDATACFQRDNNSKQPGDLKKAAQAILEITEIEQPPLRLLLGSDAFNGVQKNDAARMKAI